MKASIKMIRMLGLGFIAAIFAALIVGCEYDVPITSGPTEKVNDRLIGNWVSENGADTIKIRRFDDYTYVAAYNGHLFRAYHSGLDSTPFVSAEDVDWASRKYCYRTWTLSPDGARLTLHSINAKLVSRDIKDLTEIQALLRKNLGNPELFIDEIQFNKKN